MTDRSEQIRQSPIGNSLDAVRSTFNSICNCAKNPCTVDTIDRLGAEDLRNLTLPLLFALQSHILSRSLPSKSGSKNFQSDLRLISAAASGNFEFNRVKPLLKSALSIKVDDFTIWDQAYSAVSETTPPPRTIASSLQQTPWLHSILPTMTDQPQSDIIKANPIGSGLSTFLDLFKSTCRDATCQLQAVDQLKLEDLQNLVFVLLSTLQILPAARLLPTRTGNGTLRSELSRLNTSITTNDFELNRAKPLLKAALADNPDDELIWRQVSNLVIEATPSPRTIASSLQQTPWQRNTSSFANSSEHRRYVDDILKEELGTMYVGLPGFWDAYFGGVVGLEAASKEFFGQCLTGSNPAFHNDDGWEGWPQDANEKRVLLWLADFVKKLVVFADTQKSNTTHQRGLLLQPNTPMQGSTADRKLDVGFVDKLEDDEGSRYHWKQILVPGELKSNPSADIASKAWLDLGRYAREVLAAQDTRRFVLGFTLCGPLMRVWSFDRLGAIASEQFNINKDGLQFVFTVLGFLWMDEEALGFDPTVKLSDNKRFINIKRNGSTERIVIDGVILRARCVAGRAATCWKAHPEGHPETPLVIKDSWQYPERDEEGDLLREVTDKGVVNVARYYHHETVQVHETDDDIWNNIRHSLDVTAASNYRPGQQMRPSNMAKDTTWKGRSSTSRKRPSSQTDSILPPSKRSCSISPTKAASMPPNRVHRRIILQDYGKPIYKASSRSALLAALVGCIEGHESLYKAGILHRDVSINNLMINEDSGNPSWPAFLIDLDLAIRQPRESASGAKGKTGTRAFMAIGALLGEQHSFMHDLESFFWVLFWICIHYDENGKDIGPTEFDSWNYESDTKLILSKVGTIGDESLFLKIAADNFTPYHQPLVTWVNKLRKQVFPSDERWKMLEPKLYSSMKNILHDAQKDPEVLAGT